MIRLAILDLDGPILEGSDRHYQCYSDIISDLGFHPLPQADYWEMKRNRIDRTIQLEKINASHLYDEFLSEWMKRIETRKYLTLDRVQAGVRSTLTFMRENNVRTVLITMRNCEDNLNWQLKELGLQEFFDEVVPVTSELGVESKYDTARSLLDAVLPTEAIWVGDTEADILPAKKLGIRACAIDTGLRTREYLESLAPDHLVHHISGIKPIVLASA